MHILGRPFVLLAFLPVLLGGMLLAAAVPATRSATTEPVIDGPVERRPVLTEELYQKLAAELRASYAADPSKWPAAHLDDGVALRELGVVEDIPFPKENPYSKPKAELGKRLFFERRLSSSMQISCANCHDPELAWADGRSNSFGHDRQLGKRNAPTLLNAGLLPTVFWDGRAASLEDQVFMPISSDVEMHSSPDEAAKNIASIEGYQKEFAAVFGDASITPERIAQAIATFERTIKSGRSRFDLFVKGRVEALSDSAIRGLHLFRTDANCLNCHNGANFSDGQFHNVGLSYYGRAYQDLGRYEITKKAADVGAFKTPTLRNIGSTRPYMHNGLFPEIDGVLNMYNAGMPTLLRKPSQLNDPLFPTKDRHLRPLGLNQQDLADLKSFLESLDEPDTRVRPPEAYN